MFSRINFIIFIVAFFGLRIFSYFFGPETPLQTQNIINTVASAIILTTTTYLLIQKNIWGWYIIILEIILGGAGGFLSIGSIALRTCLLFVSIAIFDIQKIVARQYLKKLRENFPITIILSALYAVVGISALRGYYLGHDPGLIFAEALPYLFFLYYYPLRELIIKKNFINVVLNALVAAIVGNAIFILFTIITYSSGLFIIGDSYYHWYRDVALGKITEVAMGFYRLVLNEQLLITPIILFFLYRLMNKKGEKWLSILCTFSLLFTLGLNLTRIYMVALFVGTLFLFNRDNWKKWLMYSFGAATIFILLFVSTHLITTRGQSLGLEIFGLRLQSIIQPHIEDSSLSRMLLLPKIWENVKKQPIIGNGLADSISVYSPVFKKEISTTNFDWGYLEMWDELGIIGLMVWLGLLIFIFFKPQGSRDEYKKICISMIVSFLIINITSPALFHVMGVIFLSIILFI